jgi:hypothetical protein
MLSLRPAPAQGKMATSRKEALTTKEQVSWAFAGTRKLLFIFRQTPAGSEFPISALSRGAAWVKNKPCRLIHLLRLSCKIF